MQPHGVILAIDTRLLRELLRRAIAKAPGLQVAGEAAGPVALADLARRTGAQWVIVSLQPDGALPPEADALLQKCPAVHVLAVASDGSQLRVKETGSSGDLQGDLSLDEVVAILRARLPEDMA